MAQKRKIQDHDWLYSLLRPWVDFTLKRSYRAIHYTGREKLPKEGAYIFAPNHTNALMDALVVLAMDSRAKVFVARADIFRNPLLAKIFHFLKIMPIMRIRDGYEEVKKNNETIEKAVDVLRDRVPFCIFPEGTHQAKYSSLPLSKGIFRIAMQAQQEMPEMPLYIVPVGIRYGNFFRFRSTARVEIGDPISVGEFMAEHSDQTPQEQMNSLKELLSERMHALIHYIPNDENYEAVCELCAATFKESFRRQKPLIGHRLDKLFRANKESLGEIDRLLCHESERSAELLALANEASRLRRERQISFESVAARHSWPGLVGRIFLLLVTLPYLLPAALATLPIVGLTQFLCGKFADKAFHNSVRYLINLLLWPLLMIIYTTVLLFTLPWVWALVVALLLLPAPIVVQEYWRALRLLVSGIRLKQSTDLRGIYREIRQKMSHQNS